ncbi:MAG TPA: DUF4012 domain-containing protein, partial [Actinomycetota bacterium]|nr:DUF4012 domain-containing protein [Actinomycetota bacterium]
ALVPFVGRTPDALQAVAEAGARVARAGEALAGGLGALPGGPAALGPVEGRLPIEAYERLAGSVAAAEGSLGEALAALRPAPTSLLPASVLRARLAAQAMVEELHDLLGTAGGLLRELPAFLGADRPRRYFFGAENPAELRGTGGLVGAYAILEVRDGRPTFSRFRPIQSLPLLDRHDVPGPTDDYVRNYDRFRDGNGFWLNINMTPDFPTAARAILTAYEAATGEPLDGVVTTDPVALASIVEATGPVRVPRLGVELDAEELVPFLTVEARALFEEGARRKAVLGEVSAAVLDRFLRDRPSLEGLAGVMRTASAGHLRVFSADPAVEALLERTTVGGTLPVTDGDFVGFVQNNAGANKLDLYQRTTLSYDVTLGDGGTASGVLAVSLENRAPRDAVAPSRAEGLAPLENAALVQLYCARGCLPRSFVQDARRLDLRGGVERGYPFLRTFVRIPRGDTLRLAASFELSEAWDGDGSGGTYRLTVLTPPTIEPVRVSIAIRLPPGMGLRWSDPALEREGDALRYEGTPGRRLDIAVRFEPPLPVRLWRDLLEVLSTPVLPL